MATNLIPQDLEEILSQALSWETCSQSSWSLASGSYQQSSAYRDNDPRTSDIKIIYVPPSRHNNKRNVSNIEPEPEPEPEAAELIPSSRYLQGRPPLREDGNPKGKHPRKPLPSWRLNKLKRISNRDSVAEDYRELIWHEQREAQRQERKVARGQTLDNQGHRVFTTGRPSPANMKKKKAKITKRRKSERKRVNRAIHDGDNPPKPPPTNKTRPPATIPLNREIEKRKKWMEGYIKPHYFTLLDALARQKGHAEYAWGCDYCEERLRDLKTTRFKNWKSQAVINGLEDVMEHDHLEEIVRDEIEKYKLEDEGNCRYQVSMDEIVRLREEPGYVVRYRSGKRKRGGKKQAVGRKEVAAGDISDLPVKGRNNTESEDEWEDLVGVGQE